jgi:hypothetical protein
MFLELNANSIGTQKPCADMAPSAQKSTSQFNKNWLIDFNRQLIIFYFLPVAQLDKERSPPKGQVRGSPEGLGLNLQARQNAGSILIRDSAQRLMDGRQTILSGHYSNQTLIKITNTNTDMSVILCAFRACPITFAPKLYHLVKPNLLLIC